MVVYNSGMTCSIEDCEKEARSKSMCQTHYMREYRARNKGECSIDECSSNVYSKGYCETHYKYWLMETNPDYRAAQESLNKESKQRAVERKKEERSRSNPYGFKKSVVSYEMAHKRMWRVLGKASGFACVDCGNPAKHWSLNKEAENVLMGSFSGVLMEYSLNMDDYSPRCPPCHSAYDSKSW